MITQASADLGHQVYITFKSMPGAAVLRAANPLRVDGTRWGAPQRMPGPEAQRGGGWSTSDWAHSAHLHQ